MVKPEVSLTQVMAGGIAWSWGGVVAISVVQLVYTAVMSRLLSPADFGLVAVAMVGLRFVSQVSRFGLGSAVTQRPDLNRNEIGVALRLSVGIGFLAAGMAFALSPLLAALVKEPNAVNVMRWLSLSVFVGAITTVPEALIRRQLRFRALTSVQIASFAAGYLGIGIPLALTGWGVWSLVAATVAQTTAYLVLTAVVVPPPLKATFSRKTVTELLSFGGLVTFTGYLEFLNANIDTISVGRWVGAVGLGQYSRATLLVALPVEQATSAISRVLLPTLSKVQNQPARFARAITRGMGLQAIVVLVPMAAISASADAVVSLVLGRGWEVAASVLPIVGAAYGLALLTNLPAVAAEARGLVKLKLVVQLMSVALTGIYVSFVVATGPTLHRLAVAWMLGELSRHLLYLVVIFPVLGIPRSAAVLRYLVAGCLALGVALPLFVIVRILDFQGFGALFLGGAAGLLLGAGIAASPVGRLPRSDFRSIRQSMAREPKAER